MADLLDRIREEIGTRLEELRPLVEESGRLTAALQALGDIASASASTPEQAKPGVRRASPAKPRRRAARGANREAVLRAAAQRPGATGAELAAVSGVERNTLNALLARLVQAGELQKRELPTGRTGYAPS